MSQPNPSSRGRMNDLRYDGHWGIDDIVPNLIIANSAIQGGEPTICGTRIPTSVIGNQPESAEDVADDYCTSPLTVIAARCFEAGREWQRSWRRRQRMINAVKYGWEQVNLEKQADKGDV